MKRREFITLVGGAAATWPLVARAQQSSQMRRIALLMAAGDEGPGQAQAKAFQAGLETLGWIDGRNLRIEIRWAAGNIERYGALAAELIGLAPEVIVTQSNTVTTVVSRLTRTIPIVFAGASDPLETGLITNMARPGGNVTGFAQLEIAIAGKYLELLKEAAPRLTRVAVLYGRGGITGSEFLKKIGALAPSFRVQASSIPTNDPDEIDRAINAFSREPNGGLIVLSGPTATARRERIFALAAQHRLPAIYPYRFFATDGGLMSYGPDIIEQYRRAASYVDRILKGEKPADLPVQAPTRYETVLNVRTAKALGLTVPPGLLVAADEVIE
jgi:putative ABC transport system substrate-binding protein